MPALKVKKAYESELYSDIVRVHKKDRDGLAKGSIVEVLVEGKKGLFVLRGCADNDKGSIRFDSDTRHRLNLEDGTTYCFVIRKVGFLDGFFWSLRASDTAYRVSSQIAAIAAFLGIVSAVLGIVSVVLAVCG